MAERKAEPTRSDLTASDAFGPAADEINRRLREASVKDEYRPAIVAAIMLALWHARGHIRNAPAFVLADINAACAQAFRVARREELAAGLRVDETNEKLADRAGRIADVLRGLGVDVLTGEHDYLGRLYEALFRYTGGNTIGQYFTPRHVTRFMADLCAVGTNDVVLDPACGTGGFLLAALARMRRGAASVPPGRLMGFESEPVTAALCAANMILHGDGAAGIVRADCFTSPRFPVGQADVVLMNPPFPHRRTDATIEAFVERALAALRPQGRLAVILPTSLLVKKDKGGWRGRILQQHALRAICQLPDELFQPYAAATTSVVLMEKGMGQQPRRAVACVRLRHDGLVLRRRARVPRASEPDETPAAIAAIRHGTELPGFAAHARIEGAAEWAVGAYIASAPPEEDELKQAVDVQLRRLASFYARYAAEVVAQRRAVAAGESTVTSYGRLVSAQRARHADRIPRLPGTIGGAFAIFYGMKALHSREGFGPGTTLVISPTEHYNGCYGWLDFDRLIAPPFVTVAQTGSIGEAFVQFEPCGVNDDCLVLLPNPGIGEAMLVLAAAVLHAERWRFTYGRKLTPQRIASFVLPASAALAAWVAQRLELTRAVIAASLRPYLEGGLR